METLKFRELRADELEVRVAREVGQNKDKVELFVFKNARVDANILDETVGQFGWACQFQEQSGTLFCGIALKDAESGQWIWKWDAGAPSNIEQAKGEASDAFKRSAFKWGIGRALYTAPRIIVTGNKYDAFKVASIGYADGKICDLIITCKGRVVFNYENFNVVGTSSAKQGEDNVTLLKAFCREQLNNQLASEKVLTKFYEYYSGKVSSWQNKPDFNRLLDKWIASEY